MIISTDREKLQSYFIKTFQPNVNHWNKLLLRFIDSLSAFEDIDMLRQECAMNFTNEGDNIARPYIRKVSSTFCMMYTLL